MVHLARARASRCALASLSFSTEFAVTSAVPRAGVFVAARARLPFRTRALIEIFTRPRCPFLRPCTRKGPDAMMSVRADLFRVRACHTDSGESLPFDPMRGPLPPLFDLTAIGRDEPVFHFSRYMCVLLLRRAVTTPQLVGARSLALISSTAV